MPDAPDRRFFGRMEGPAENQPCVCPRCGEVTLRLVGDWLRVYAAGVEVRRSTQWRCDKCQFSCCASGGPSTSQPS